MKKKRIKICSILFFTISVLSLFSFENIHAEKREKLQFTNVDSKKITIFRGKKKRLKLPSSIKEEIFWHSSRPKIASVSNKGRVRALKKGKTKITARLLNSRQTISVYIMVKRYIAPKKINLTTENSRVILENDTLLMQASIYPKRSSKNTIEWTSSNPEIASVSDEGLVTGLTPGRTKISVRIKGTSIKCSKYIKVKRRIIKAESLTFLQQTMTIKYGDTVSLPYQLLPENTTNQTLRFYSSYSNIVSVNESGQITGLRPGSSTITAKTCDGTRIAAVIHVTVNIDNGFLTKADLDALDLSSYDNLMIVAHPDDETIFGGSQMISDNYLVVCLTSGYNPIRKNEYFSVLNQTNDRGLMLSYPDLTYIAPGQLKRDDWATVNKGMKKDIQLLLQYKNWKKIVTHNPNGEYSHQHHIMTSKYVTEKYNETMPEQPKLYYFGYYSTNYVKQHAAELATIPEENLKKKREILKLYTTQQNMVSRLSHMDAYEFLIPVSEWVK